MVAVVPLRAAAPYFGLELPAAGWPGLRQAGLRAYAAGLPSPREEAWRYFPIETLKARQEQPGQWTLDAGSPALPGVGDLARSEGNPFVAANTAGFDRAIALAGDTRASLRTAGLTLPRLTVGVPAGGRAAVALDLRGGGFANLVVEADVGPGARLEFVLDQGLDEGAALVAHLAVRVAEAARFDGFLLQAGAAMARIEAEVTLAGRGADARVSGATLGRGSQHLEIATRFAHAVAGATSRQVFRSVLDDRAHGVFQGRIEVARGAVGTDAHQLAKTLLLSRRAIADTKPELEIYADDVKCSHGATVGEIEAEQMFYLRSRGIPAAAARAMLVAAFLDAAVEEVPGEAARAQLRARLEGLLA
ncbi:MAG: Fe-S cluster assembly protein SufD [Thalassobaculales bacterium]